MAPNPDIRASDADRDRVAASLRENCALGRITMDELQERLEAVYEAKTIGRLQEITSDLPEEDLYQLPVPASQPKSTASVAKPSSDALEERSVRAMWGTWAAVSAVNFAVWAILLVTYGAVYPWWLWVAGPWGAVLLVRTVLAERGRGD